MMGNLMQDRLANLRAHSVFILRTNLQNWPAKDSDFVGSDQAVTARTHCKRHTLVQAEQGTAGAKPDTVDVAARGLFLYGHHNIVDDLP